MAIGNSFPSNLLHLTSVLQSHLCSILHRFPPQLLPFPLPNAAQFAIPQSMQPSMAEKRSRNGQPNQLVPLAIKPAARSAAPPHAASPTPGPQSEEASDGHQGVKASSFWIQKGVVTFFWLDRQSAQP